MIKKTNLIVWVYKNVKDIKKAHGISFHHQKEMETIFNIKWWSKRGDTEWWKSDDGVVKEWRRSEDGVIPEWYWSDDGVKKERILNYSKIKLYKNMKLKIYLNKIYNKLNKFLKNKIIYIKIKNLDID